MHEMKILGVIVALLISTTATAINTTYLQAVQKTQEKSFAEAASLYRSQLQVFADNPIYLNRTRVWLALSLLVQDDVSREAETALREVLCSSLTIEENTGVETGCSSGKTWSPTTQIDTDMISAAVAAYASILWRRSEYQTALKLLNLTILRALATKPTNAKLVPSQLDVSQPNNPAEGIVKGQLDRETTADMPRDVKGLADSLKSEMLAVLKEKMANADPNHTGNTPSGDPKPIFGQLQQAMQQMVITQRRKQNCIKARLAEHQQKISQRGLTGREAYEQLKRMATDGFPECDDIGATNTGLSHDERNAAEARRQLSKVASAESEIFYRMAKSTMCRNLNNTGGQLGNSMAVNLEALRGQYVQSFKIAQRPVLTDLNKLLDSKQKLPKRFDQFAFTAFARENFLKSLARCSNSLNLEPTFSQALVVALTRPSRPHRNEKYLKLLISTASRLRVNNRFVDTIKDVSAASEHWILGSFYLRTHQTARALPELQQALTGYSSTGVFTPSPEIDYLYMFTAARILQSIVITSLQTDHNTGRLQQALLNLRQDVESLYTHVNNHRNMSSKQTQLAKLNDMKQLMKETFRSQKMSGTLQEMESMLAQTGQDQSYPLAFIQQLEERLTNGALVDEKIAKIQTREVDATATLKASFDSSLKLEYLTYNGHSQLMLQLAHIELDLNKADVAKQQLREAESYIQARPGWIGERTRAYLDFTRARLYQAENKNIEAMQAFSRAVYGWYFTPHSMYEMIMAPLESPLVILEYATDFAISQNQHAQAFNFIELTRKVDWNSDQFYGALSDQDLVAVDRSLHQQLLHLENIASRRADDLDETQAFKSVLKKNTVSTEQNKQDQVGSNYQLLNQVVGLKRWLKAQDLGGFVEIVLQQINRRQAQTLKQKRLDFIYQQQGMASAEVSKRPSSQRPDDAMTLSSRIQQKLSDDTLVISIWMGRDSSYITALDNTDVRAHHMPSQSLLRKVKTFNASYKRAHGYQLYQTLFSPYLDRPYRRIVLLTNGPLQNTAFAALSTDADKQLWFGDRYLIRSLPNAARLLNADKPNSGTSRVLVLDGSSMPGEKQLAATEIDIIIKNFSTDQISGTQLSRENLMQLLPQYSVTHFAGHSEINNNFPDFSHLALYNDKAYLLEIEQLPLEKVNLIVLGSCESAAHVDYGVNNRFSSLQESLINAGAGAVLANLFPVNDQVASEFMSRFYELLAQGLAKDSALQQAQQFIRAKNPNPKDWAGFVLSGSKLAL